MQRIVNAVVGSQLHGLATENSDVDRVVVQASSIRDILSPFSENAKRHPQTVTPEEDVTTFEYQHFVKLLTTGNPTVLEVIYSNQLLEASHTWISTVKHIDHLLDKERIFKAHFGYSHAQLKLLNEHGINSHRGRKSACAYIRTLHQGATLLVDRRMTYPVEGDIKEVLSYFKFTEEDIDYNVWAEEKMKYEDLLTEAVEISTLVEADLEVAEWLIEHAYTDWRE